MKQILLAGLVLAGMTSQGAVTFDWLTVDNPGNANDTSGYGGVAYTYRIAAYEVTNGQYVEFLNAKAASDPNGLYNANMDITRSGSSGSYTYTVNSGFGPNPVNYVSFFDSMRFVNWLENGQGTGDTESGVYTIGSGTDETRSGTASYFLPSEDEWYKSAYYDPRAEVGGGPTGDDNYWLYSTQSDTQPTSEAPPGGANSANFYDGGYAVGDTSDVGAYTGTASFYGGFDLGGNVWEWNEALIGSSRGIRGGSWSSSGSYLSSSYRFSFNPANEVNSVGFRVASSFDSVEAVPEPGTVGMIALAPLRRTTTQIPGPLIRSSPVNSVKYFCGPDDLCDRKPETCLFALISVHPEPHRDSQLAVKNPPNPEPFRAFSAFRGR